MSSHYSVAAKLPPDVRQQLALKALAGNDHMAEENVSRQFIFLLCMLSSPIAVG
jgi:hypothetical protein